MTDTCIEFDDVVAGYKDFMILNNLSFAVPKGSITLLIGPNGAGKSTVLKTLFGLLTPRQGKIRMNGEDITGATQKTCWRAASPLCPKAATCLASFRCMRTWSWAASPWA